MPVPTVTARSLLTPLPEPCQYSAKAAASASFSSTQGSWKCALTSSVYGTYCQAGMVYGLRIVPLKGSTDRLRQPQSPISQGSHSPLKAFPPAQSSPRSGILASVGTQFAANVIISQLASPDRRVHSWRRGQLRQAGALGRDNGCRLVLGHWAGICCGKSWKN